MTDDAPQSSRVPVQQDNSLSEKASAPDQLHDEDSQSTVRKADALKFAGLIAVFAIMAAIVVALWPYLSDIFNEGGVDRLVERVQSAGPLGVLMLLGMQLLQIVVAFIPGEVVQMAAGVMYGPLLGALIILVGCVISSSIVYKLVDTLGAPFVQSMVSTEHLEKFHHFEATGKLDIIVFILFLIPAMPKDVFTYLVPLTDMPLKRFVILSNTARIPGILISTFIASGLAEGNVVSSVIVAVVAGAIAILAIVYRKQLMDKLAQGYPEE